MLVLRPRPSDSLDQLRRREQTAIQIGRRGRRLTPSPISSAVSHLCLTLFEFLKNECVEFTSWDIKAAVFCCQIYLYNSSVLKGTISCITFYRGHFLVTHRAANLSSFSRTQEWIMRWYWWRGWECWVYLGRERVRYAPSHPPMPAPRPRPPPTRSPTATLTGPAPSYFQFLLKYFCHLR